MPAHFLTSPLLGQHGFRHAFFTRLGGVSRGPYASLNFSYAVGDNAADVDENLRLAASALGLPPGRLYFPSQVHGNGAIHLTGREEQRAVRHTEGDAIYSSSQELACCVRVADCVPVLLADRSTGTVAAAHAGWRGAVANVVRETLTAARNATGTSGAWIAAIGPHISTEAFEVSPEVAQEIVNASPNKGIVAHDCEPKPHIDLRAMIRSQLAEQGLQARDIDDVPGCTVSDKHLFFSYRRDGAASGRHLAAIVARA